MDTGYWRHSGSKALEKKFPEVCVYVLNHRKAIWNCHQPTSLHVTPALALHPPDSPELQRVMTRTRGVWTLQGNFCAMSRKIVIKDYPQVTE